MASNTIFSDRADAGRRLAPRIAELHLDNVIVYALPRGGVPVAVEIAAALHAPLDLALVRKIGAPGNPEVAVAAVVVDGDRPRVVVNEDVRRMTGVSAAYLEREGARELLEIERRRRLYLGSRPRQDPAGKSAVIVDDGLATGATARAAVQALRAEGAARVIVAVPVAPPETAALLRREADALICLAEPDPFYGVGAFYADFHQLADREVLQLLERADEAAAAGRR